MFEIIDTFIDSLLKNLGVWGPVVGSLLIIIESILPILPLFVFITINFLVFGNILGFLISWICTSIGCSISFFIFREKIQLWCLKKIKNNKYINVKTINKITALRFEQLTPIIAIPFTPAFLVNIACGLSNMSYKKFIFAIIIGKAFIVYFWGFIGVSLLESIKNPIYLVKVGVMMLVAYIVSKIINKRLNIVE